MPERTGELWWSATGRSGAPPLVLVPDAHRPASVWPSELVGGLLDGGWRVVRLDLRDQGRSPRATGALTVGDLAADLAAVLAAVADTGPVHLVGHGLGASVALRLAVGGPRGRPTERVTRLTLVGASAWPADPTLAGPDEPTAVGLVWRHRLGDGDGLVTALAREERLLAGPDDPGPAAAAAEVRRWLAHGFNPADGHRAAWLTAPPLGPALARNARRLAPVTIVHGSSDPLVPPAHGRRLAAALGDADVVAVDVVEVEGAGHALTPRLVSALLAAVGPAR